MVSAILTLKMFTCLDVSGNTTYVGGKIILRTIFGIRTSDNTSVTFDKADCKHFCIVSLYCMFYFSLCKDSPLNVRVLNLFRL